MRLRRLSTLVLPLLVLGCERSTTEPADTAREEDLTFFRFAADAPPLSDTTVSFWAVKGDSREVEIRYESGTGAPYGGVCLEFEVDGDALLRRPDGTPFQRGDSVRITIRVVDPARFDFEFSPAGLKFDPAKPAELKVDYRWADRDFNGDGKVDAEDERIERSGGFWRQERAGDLWQRIGTVRIKDQMRVEANIEGFTRFAVASN